VARIGHVELARVVIQWRGCWIHCGSARASRHLLCTEIETK
jgi:hypothetical protein